MSAAARRGGGRDLTEDDDVAEISKEAKKVVKLIRNKNISSIREDVWESRGAKDMYSGKSKPWMESRHGTQEEGKKKFMVHVDHIIECQMIAKAYNASIGKYPRQTENLVRDTFVERIKRTINNVPGAKTKANNLNNTENYLNWWKEHAVSSCLDHCLDPTTSTELRSFTTVAGYKHRKAQDCMSSSVVGEGDSHKYGWINRKTTGMMREAGMDILHYWETEYTDAENTELWTDFTSKFREVLDGMCLSDKIGGDGGL